MICVVSAFYLTTWSQTCPHHGSSLTVQRKPTGCWGCHHCFHSPTGSLGRMSEWDFVCATVSVYMYRYLECSPIMQAAALWLQVCVCVFFILAHHVDYYCWLWSEVKILAHRINSYCWQWSEVTVLAHLTNSCRWQWSKVIVLACLTNSYRWWWSEIWSWHIAYIVVVDSSQHFDPSTSHRLLLLTGVSFAPSTSCRLLMLTGVSFAPSTSCRLLMLTGVSFAPVRHVDYSCWQVSILPVAHHVDYCWWQQSTLWLAVLIDYCCWLVSQFCP